jgi:hypothetical protein
MNYVRFCCMLIIVAVLFQANAYALQKSISVSGGLATFSEHYNTSAQAMGRLELQSYNGVGIDLNAGYIYAKSSQSGIPQMKMIPVLAGINYTIRSPFSTIEPYAGIMCGASMMNDAFNSTILTYGARAGINLKMDHATSVYVETQYLRADDDKTNLNINPITVGIGLKRYIGNDRSTPLVGKQPSRVNYNRRMNQRYQRR